MTLDEEFHRKDLISHEQKLTLYHFHRVSKELKTKVNILYSFGQISFFMLFILIGRSEKNRETFHLLIENCLSAVENL